MSDMRNAVATARTRPNRGYRQTGRLHAETYVRNRHFGSNEGRWTTVDPLWPSQLRYVYGLSSPTTRVDRSGRSSVVTNCCWTGAAPQLANQYAVTPTTPSKCMKKKNGDPVTGYVGNGFDVKLSLSPTKLDNVSTSPPQVVWWECSNEQLTQGSQAGQWVDRTSDLAQSICPDTWKSLNYDCTGDVKGAISDEPAMLLSRIASLGANCNKLCRIRNLFIYVAFVFDSSCPDSKAKIQPLKIFQQITWDPASNQASSVLMDSWPSGQGPKACQTPPNGWP